MAAWWRRDVRMRQRLRFTYDWWYRFATGDGRADTDSMTATNPAPVLGALRAEAPPDALV